MSHISETLCMEKKNDLNCFDGNQWSSSTCLRQRRGRQRPTSNYSTATNPATQGLAAESSTAHLQSKTRPGGAAAFFEKNPEIRAKYSAFFENCRTFEPNTRLLMQKSEPRFGESARQKWKVKRKSGKTVKICAKKRRISNEKDSYIRAIHLRFSNIQQIPWNLTPQMKKDASSREI